MGLQLQLVIFNVNQRLHGERGRGRKKSWKSWMRSRWTGYNIMRTSHAFCLRRPESVCWCTHLRSARYRC